MIDKFKQLSQQLTPVLLRRRVFLTAVVAIVGAIVYWGLAASNRYVSEAHVIIERTNMSSGQTVDIGSLLTGATGSNRNDQLLLRSYLLSVDMLQKLNSKLNLRAHYSDSAHDFLSRMWSQDNELEFFHRHYLSRTSVELDEYSGVLIIKAQAYTPEMANAIVTSLVAEGEHYMNELGHAMARDQVDFLEKQVNEMAQNALATRQALLAYQNKKGMISPQTTAETIQTAISKLDGQLTDMKARRAALLGYLSPQAPGVVEINIQIAALEKQMQLEQSRLTSPQGSTLNRTVEEYQRLEFAAKFAEDVYKTGMVALEKGRIEALRMLKKVSVLQSPTLPQYPLEPRRIYNIVVFILLALIIAGIVHMLAAIIRDHQD